MRFGRTEAGRQVLARRPGRMVKRLDRRSCGDRNEVIAKMCKMEQADLEIRLIIGTMKQNKSNWNN